jgi:hypothetical protein
MKGKFLISAIGGALGVAFFAAAALAAPGHLGGAPSSPGLATTVAHMHMGSPGHSMRMGNVGHSYSRGPMMGSPHAMHAFRSNHIGHHHHHHHHHRFFFVGVPYYDNSDCWWSRRRHHWVCPSY